MTNRRQKQYVCDNTQLMAEWDWKSNDAKGYDPKDITSGSRKLISWICPKCGMSYIACIPDRVGKNSGCPYCAHKKPIPGQNDLETWCKRNGREDLLDEWDLELNNGHIPSEYTFASNKKAAWKCSRCGNQWTQQIDQRTLRTAGCRKCHIAGTSLPEQFLYLSMNAIIGNVKNGYRGFGFELDIYLESLNIAIEYDGEYFHKTLNRSNYDSIKNEKCSGLGITLLRVCEERDSELPISIVEDTVYWRYSRQKDDLTVLLSAILCLVNTLSNNNYSAESIDINSIFQKAIQTTYRVSSEKSLAGKYPEIAAEWDYNANGDIRPEDVSSGSHDVFIWVCRKCGHSWPATVNTRTSGTGSGCPSCAVQKRSQANHRRAIDRKNFKEWCYENNSSLIYEWDYEKNQRPPEDYSTGSNDLVHWTCKICGYKWLASVYARVMSGSGCMECWNRRRKFRFRNDKIIDGKNSLVLWCKQHNQEHLLTQWDFQKNEFPPENYTYGSTKKVWWKCDNGHEWLASIKSRTLVGNGCKRCRYKK